MDKETMKMKDRKNWIETMKDTAYLCLEAILESLTFKLFILLSLLFIILFFIAKSDYGCLYTNTTEGTVYDKKIINAEVNNSVFSTNYIPTRYQLYIVQKFEINGKIYEKTAKYDVPEDIYRIYSIGDWFDSQSPWKLGVVGEKEE